MLVIARIDAIAAETRVFTEDADAELRVAFVGEVV